MSTPGSRVPGSKSDAYVEVRKMILGGEVRPGQRMSHRSLARDLGLSRSPVREALLQLEAEGLIEHRPQSGVYLREVSPQELQELYDIREALEPYAAERAARLADIGQIDRLRVICAEFNEISRRIDLESWLTFSENRRRLSTLDREFHAIILAASGNRVARTFFENAQILALVFSWNFMKTSPVVLASRVAPTARQHQQIYEAIATRDPLAAGKQMRNHVAAGSKRVMAGIPADA